MNYQLDATDWLILTLISFLFAAGITTAFLAVVIDV
jgi:hypothetical protein